MARKWDRGVFEEARREVEEREKRIGFIFPPKNRGEEIHIEILDDTFTQVYEGETGLDDRTVDWTQPQILVRDLKDDRKKAFKLNSGLATQMWRVVENAGGNPLDMRGSVFTITSMGNYNYEVVYRKPAKEPEIVDESKIEDIVKKVISSGNIPKENVSLWVKEYLKVEGLEVPEAVIESVVNRVVG